jgi:hypothetical protein
MKYVIGFLFILLIAMGLGLLPERGFREACESIVPTGPENQFFVSRCYQVRAIEHLDPTYCAKLGNTVSSPGLISDVYSIEGCQNKVYAQLGAVTMDKTYCDKINPNVVMQLNTAEGMGPVYSDRLRKACLQRFK